MRRIHFSIVFALIIAVALLAGTFIQNSFTSQAADEVYVGVYAGSTNATDLMELTDKVKTFTNFFVVGSLGVTWNYTALNQVCQYLSESELNFMTFVHPKEDFPFAQWISDAKNDWVDRFLGLYAYDEPGGYQIDRTTFMAAAEADDYADASKKYVENVTEWLNQLREWGAEGLPMIASDYALYEYDYRAGYDTILCDFGWNFSRPLHVALCRGAATMHNKTWGAIITWTYTQPPYLESGERIFEDMVYAYDNGAKYILVFDFDKNTTRGTLQPEHLSAMERFWAYMKNHPRKSNAAEDRITFVLPKNYGYGFRGPADKIWGLWEADELSAKSLWCDANTLAEHCAPKLDIIYEDTLQESKSPYKKVIFWNWTVP